MTKIELVDALIESEEENKELTERLRVACETIEQLKRVNKEWEALWEPIDDLVRPLTPLGESVGDKAVELLTEKMQPDSAANEGDPVAEYVRPRSVVGTDTFIARTLAGTELKSGDKLYLHPSTKPQRITEQDAQEDKND